jgi:SCF-associated factor 1
LAGEVGNAFESKDSELDRVLTGDGREDAAGDEIDGEIQCYTWTMEGIEPLRLPELPPLPTLKAEEVPQPRLVKIAAGDQFIVGLTDGGHVLKLDVSDVNSPNAIKELALLFQQRVRGWEYVRAL